MGSTTVVIRPFVDTLIVAPASVGVSSEEGFNYLLNFVFGSSGSSPRENTTRIIVSSFSDQVVVVPGTGEDDEDLGIYDFSYDGSYE